ncbi:cation diffusion facilitator family transporter [Adhaeribacter terreus]|uniref:Cation diffusion facilitator family transporter n=1 Tax=Adhaeribacter terreus TaxID=529703 RepID=A0ABW0ECP3_9BACT
MLAKEKTPDKLFRSLPSLSTHTHDHSHLHHAHVHAGKNLVLAFWINTAFAIFELIGGFYINSVAVMSDAVHDFGDSVSLGLAWYFQRVAGRHRDAAFSFGYRRFSLLGVLINSAVLLLGSGFVIREALLRLFNPEPASATGMIGFAIIGLLVNGVAFLRLQKGGSLSEKAVALHFLEDVLGWLAVLIGGVVMYFVEVPWLDPALSLGIACFILINVFKNFRQSFQILLEGTPAGLEEEELRTALTTVPGIAAINDLHVWSLDGEYNVLTLHLTPDKDYTLAQTEILKEAVRSMLSKRNIHHITIELESAAASCDL